MAVRRKLPGLFDPDQDFTGDLLEGVSIPEIPMLGESQPNIGAITPPEEIPPRPGEWMPDPLQPRRRPVPGSEPPPEAPEVPPEAPPEPPVPPPPPAPPPSSPFLIPFRNWYGTDPSGFQLADYERQGAGDPRRINQVLQNLYRESPAYDPQRPFHQQWTAPPQAPPPPPSEVPAAPAQAPPGFDQTKWANAEHQTPKYVVGRLVASYGGDVAAAMPVIQALFPGARLVGDDKIDFGAPLGIIDVRTGAGAAWWNPVSPGAPGGPGGAPGGAQTAPSAGAAPSGFDIGTLLDLIRQAETFAGPQGPGVFQDSAQLPGQFEETPVQQVGQDPFSQLASGGLAALLEALSGPGSAEQLLLERGQREPELPEDLTGRVDELLAQMGAPSEAERLLLERGRSETIPADVLNRRMESVREAAERTRRSEVDTLRAGLAERNLISVSGAPQGVEKTGMERISEALLGQQYGALRDISTDLMQQYASESLAALQTAASAGSARAGQAASVLGTLIQAYRGQEDQAMQALVGAAAAGSSRAQTILQVLAEATTRQQMLSEVALGTLDRNMAWNKFLAEFGLERDQVMEELRAGRLAALYPLINQFLQSAGIAAGGFV